jgi:deoxyribodipyrimidine photo-lyase
VWLSELIWRDFYFQILANFPACGGAQLQARIRRDRWEHGKQPTALFGLVRGPHRLPAGGRRHGADQPDGLHAQPPAHGGGQLPVKDLGIDWRWGERYFAQHLNDFDLAANNGGWQWASSSGCDAQPYFRIFNPVSQSEKFDPQGKFIRRYLPQLAGLPDAAMHAPWKAAHGAAGRRCGAGQDYPQPIVRTTRRASRRCALRRRARKAAWHASAGTCCLAGSPCHQAVALQ